MEKSMVSLFRQNEELINSLPIDLQSSMNHFLLNAEKNSELIEIFNLALYASSHTNLLSDQKLINSVAENAKTNFQTREWLNFNSNILMLLDVKCFPNAFKENTRDFSKLLELIDDYSPKKFYPNVHKQKDIISKIQISSINDVINFNHQFKKIYSFLKRIY